MGLAKLIQYALIALAVWVLYKGVRNMFGGPGRPAPGRKRATGRAKAGEVMDEMVQDPACGTYLPKHQALRVWVKGQERYFCSEACRDRFLEESKNKTA